MESENNLDKSEVDNKISSLEPDFRDRNDAVVGIHEELFNLIRNESPESEIKDILSKGEVNINYRNVHGDSFIHMAVRKRRENIVKLLIDSGADLTITNKEKFTPLGVVQMKLIQFPTSDKWISMKKLLIDAESKQPKKPIKKEALKKRKVEKKIIPSIIKFLIPSAKPNSSSDSSQSNSFEINEYMEQTLSSSDNRESGIGTEKSLNNELNYSANTTSTSLSNTSIYQTQSNGEGKKYKSIQVNNIFIKKKKNHSRYGL